MATARAITRNTFYIFVSGVMQKLVNVVFVAVAARLLGAHGYGQFLLVTTMVVLVATLANLGIRPFIVRMLSREKERTGQVLSNVLAVRVLVAGIAYGALVAFVHLAGYDREVLVLTAIGGLAIFSTVAQDSLEAVLVAYQRMKLLGGLSVMAAAVGTVAGVAVLWSGLGSRWLFAARIAVEASFVLVTASLIWRRIVRFRPQFDPAVMKGLIVAGLPFLVAFLLGFMDAKVDILMLSLVKGPLDSTLAIGYYGPAHTILMAAMLLPKSLNQVLVPVVSQKIYVDQAAVREIVEKATKVIILTVSFPIILVTTLFSEQIVAILLGSQYGPTARALVILGWAYGLYALNIPSHSVLGSMKEMRHFLPVLVGSFLLNVTLNFFLIPRYSYIGAAMGSVIVIALGFCGRFYLLHKILDMRLSSVRPYGKLFLVLFLTLAVGFAVRPHLPWLAVAAVIAAAYGALLHGVRAVEPDEWRFLAGLFARGRRSDRATLPVEAAAGATTPAETVDGGYERG
jgi:O-antigen/teichoic acid export membrane protein